MQAVVVMALACANKQPGNEADSETLREMTLELKQQQYRNGTVVDFPTTALVMQVIIQIFVLNFWIYFTDTFKNAYSITGKSTLLRYKDCENGKFLSSIKRTENGT